MLHPEDVEYIKNFGKLAKMEKEKTPKGFMHAPQTQKGQAVLSDLFPLADVKST